MRYARCKSFKKNYLKFQKFMTTFSSQDAKVLNSRKFDVFFINKGLFARESAKSLNICGLRTCTPKASLNRTKIS